MRFSCFINESAHPVQGSSREIFLARQPIFDRSLRVSGYELLYRSSCSNEFDNADAEAATLQLLQVVYCVGEQQLLGGRDAYLNFPHDLLVSLCPSVISPQRFVVEILETVYPDEKLKAACRELKRRGYRLALDDFTGGGRTAELLPLVDIVKVDILATTARQQLRLIQRHRRPDLKFLAEKVESQEQFAHLRQSGYELFQGFFFARPTMLASRQPADSKQACLELLRLGVSGEFDFQRVEATLRRDASLSYKLLRYVNSWCYGLPKHVESMRQAIALLGEAGLRRWLTVTALAELAVDKPTELMVLAVSRGLFCEAVAGELAWPGPKEELFLLGLFSLLDAMTGRPMAEMIAELGLNGEVRGALLDAGNHPGVTSALLRLLTAYERGMWDDALREALRLSMDPARLASVHIDCSRQGHQMLANSI